MWVIPKVSGELVGNQLSYLLNWVQNLPDLKGRVVIVTNDRELGRGWHELEGVSVYNLAIEVTSSQVFFSAAVNQLLLFEEKNKNILFFEALVPDQVPLLKHQGYKVWAHVNLLSVDWFIREFHLQWSSWSKSLWQLIRAYALYLYKFLAFDAEVLRVVDGVVVHHEAQKQILERFYFFPPVKTMLIPKIYPTIQSEVRDNPFTELIQEYPYTSRDPVFVLFIHERGRLDAVETFLEAFNIIAQKYRNVFLMINSDQEDLQPIEYLVLDKALASRVLVKPKNSPSEMFNNICWSQLIVDLGLVSVSLEPYIAWSLAQKKKVIITEESYHDFSSNDQIIKVHNYDKNGLLEILDNCIKDLEKFSNVTEN